MDSWPQVGQPRGKPTVHGESDHLIVLGGRESRPQGEGGDGGVMKKRVIPPPGIDPVFVPLAYEVPRPFSSSLVQRVQGFFCTKRAPVWWKRLPELFVSPLLWWWRPSQQHSRAGQSTHSLPGPVPSV